jgi:hypothetical protein
MGYALVAGNAVMIEADAGATTLAAPAFGNNITTNNVLVVFVSWGSGSVTESTVTDSAGNNYVSFETAPTYDAAKGAAVQGFYAVVINGGGTKPTVTANFWTNSSHTTPSSQPYRVLAVSEWSGGATSSILDKHGLQVLSGDHTGVTDFWKAHPSTQTPDTDNELIIAFLAQSGGAVGWTAPNLAEGTGFTALTEVVTVSPAGYVYNVEYQIQTVATAVQASWTNSSIGGAADGAAMMQGTFRALAGAVDQHNPFVKILIKAAP